MGKLVTVLAALPMCVKAAETPFVCRHVASDISLLDRELVPPNRSLDRPT